LFNGIFFSSATTTKRDTSYPYLFDVLMKFSEIILLTAGYIISLVHDYILYPLLGAVPQNIKIVEKKIFPVFTNVKH